MLLPHEATAAQDFFNVKNSYNVPVISCDAVAVKTAARTNPELYLMKGPIIQKKWGRADIEKAAR